MTISYDAQLHEEFKKDVLLGLSKTQKNIPSKYFYDERGCELFSKITRHPDYYLTNCELEILNTIKKRLPKFFNNDPFNLIELGPGDGIKAKILIEQFLNDKLDFTYLPIDISKDYLNTFSQDFLKNLPKTKIYPIHSDFIGGINEISTNLQNQNIVLFLGSSIGNFTFRENLQFLKFLSCTLHPHDFVLIGFDLQKNNQLLMKAYNDSSYITRDFNLNMLIRMNRELGANFIIDKFKHHADYNHDLDAMQSFLVSIEHQVIHIDRLQRKFKFAANEFIHVENSHKYSLQQIEQLMSLAGFEKVETFFDSKHYFADTLWRVI